MKSTAIATPIAKEDAVLLKTGELAKRTGLTVRTLHHYDAIGLLMPSARSDAGYRLYNRDDIARLHAIQALRQIGMPLNDIAAVLAQKGEPLSAVLERQIRTLDRQIEQAGELRHRLHVMQIKLAGGGEPDLPEWLSTLERMTTYGKYFTPAELKKLMVNWKKTEPLWPPVVKQVDAVMKRGVPPDADEVQPLARRWMQLTMMWMGGDLELLDKWNHMYAREPIAHNRNGTTVDMVAYIRKAIDVRMAALLRYFSIEEIRRLPCTDNDWVALADEARPLMKKTAVGSKKAQALAAKWNGLMSRAAGHDPELREKLLHAWRSDRVLRAGLIHGADVHDFLERTWSAAGRKAA
jgi:DNA-binding transcriptional MerR regulator